MTTIETTVTVDESHHISLQLPADIKPGSHKVVVIIDPITSEQLDPALFDVFKTQKKVTQQKSALSALIGMGSSGHAQNDHDQILAQAEMTANQ